MKKIRTVFAAILSLSILLQPVLSQAAYKDSEGNIHLKPGRYEQLGIFFVSLKNPEEWVESGNYFYEFLGKQEEYITIRKIKPEALQDGKLTIPKNIDGHSVLGIGVRRGGPLGELRIENIIKYGCVLDKPEELKELILPEGVEYLGTGSFLGCSGLTKIVLPESLVKIESLAFDGCTSMKEIEFSPEIYVQDRVFHGDESVSRINLKKVIIYSDSVFDFNTEYYPWFQMGEQTELYIRKYKSDSFFLETLPGYIQKLYVDERLSKFQLERAYYRWDYDYSRPLDYNVTKLIMNGKNTKLKLSEHVNKPSPLDENDNFNCGVKGLYTVKDAKSIKEARKYKLTYYWKAVGKAKEVTAKKKSGAYKASWKKIKTTVHKYVYKEKKEKWKETKSSAKTLYKVYGKKTKNGSYRFITTTNKTGIQSEYKYMKAVPVKEW